MIDYGAMRKEKLTTMVYCSIFRVWNKAYIKILELETKLVKANKKATPNTA